MLTCSAAPQTAPLTTAKPTDGSTAESHAPTLSVDARLVVVPVTVRDKKNALNGHLAKDDFTLAEDGKAQTIRYFDHENNAPLTIGLLVDVSGSVRNVLDEERDASSSFLDNLLQPDRDKAFIVQFGHQADLLADVTGSLPKLQAGLKRIDPDADRPQLHNTSGSGGPGTQSSGTGDPSANTQDSSRDNGNGGSGDRDGRGNRSGAGRGGGTVLYDAIFLSSDEVISKQANRKALILLTDGEDRGSKESISSAIESAQRANTTVYAIYFKGEEPRSFGNGGGFPGGGRRGSGFPGGGGGYPGGGGGGRGGQGGGGQVHEDGRKVLERICDETGGRMFQVSKKEPVTEIYRQIAEELRSQYRLGFTPTDTSDGYHRIVVDTPKDKKLVLQARDGYYTGAAAK